MKQALVGFKINASEMNASEMNKDEAPVVLYDKRLFRLRRIALSRKLTNTSLTSSPQSNAHIRSPPPSAFYGRSQPHFKAARLACDLSFIDKVFFVVERKDLDYQTMKEYQRFSPDSVNGSDNTVGLKCNTDKDDNKIVVTTIQKLNHLMKAERDLPVYQKQVVFIFDECHRSQLGEAQKNLKKTFKKYYQFGFTGTPIFPENALSAETTASSAHVA